MVRPSILSLRGVVLTLAVALSAFTSSANAIPGSKGKGGHDSHDNNHWGGHGSHDGHGSPGNGNGHSSMTSSTMTPTTTVESTSSTIAAECGLETPSVVSTGVENPPVKYGMLLFQAFEILDVYGPLEILNELSRSFHLELSLISSADNLSVVTTKPITAAMNPLNSTVYPSIPPTHSMADPPMDLDVLIIPGGLGTRSPYLNATIDYVAKVYPNLQYLISVCTGASIAARAGVLDGKRATTNKASWSTVVSYGNNVTWVPQARWVQDGNVWSSSGISAGMDAVFAFVNAMYGSSNATNIADLMEYDRHVDPSWDPFAAIWGVL